MTKRKRKRRLLKIGSISFASLMFLFLYLPILVVIVFSFNTSKVNVKFEGFTLDWYGKMLDNAPLMDALGNTLIVAAASTMLSVFIGTLAAVGMFRFSFRGKSVLDALLYIPIIIPEIVMGISLLAFFSTVNLQGGMLTLIIAHVTFSMPFVVITVRSRVAGYDQSVEEAAMDLGATRFRTFLRVTLPIIAPGVMSGAMLALTMSLDDVVVSFFTNGNTKTLPIYIFGKVRTGVSPDINALSTVIIVVTLAIMLIANRVKKHTEGSPEKQADKVKLQKA